MWFPMYWMNQNLRFCVIWASNVCVRVYVCVCGGGGGMVFIYAHVWSNIRAS